MWPTGGTSTAPRHATTGLHEGGARADELAMVVSQVFGEPVPAVPLAGDETVLAALQAGIAGHLAVLDDVSLTGTAQSSADVLGIGVTELAEKLTAHLLREIVLRGSRGGPLAPLASQPMATRTRTGRSKPSTGCSATTST